MMMTIVFIILCWCVGIYFLWRNNLTSEIFKKYLKMVSVAAQNDIENRRSWEWRYEEYETISYEKVLFSFWKEPEDFFKSLNCIK